ncbi:hypothetical protein EVAR_100755_1 [Eumeta japonica]|uniref:Uncharacterized protein n=1 Tax=Eumeta variegata TaxID=151549 RepID=A0A4C2A8T1_EUMVA|nr:hypothetical protein EVAR_100755_1 [Eumeta japonica]
MNLPLDFHGMKSRAKYDQRWPAGCAYNLDQVIGASNGFERVFKSDNFSRYRPFDSRTALSQSCVDYTVHPNMYRPGVLHSEASIPTIREMESHHAQGGGRDRRSDVKKNRSTLWANPETSRYFRVQNSRK